MSPKVKRAYLAGPFSSDLERTFTEMVMNAIQERFGDRLDLYVPHRDTGIVMPNSLDAQRRLAFSDDLNAMNAADIFLVLLDHESAGVCWEMGYCYARGLPMVGLWTDVHKKPNLMLEQSATIVSSIGDLLSALAQLL
ncbi:MAG: nucleoside 2-deoxyribosyltransferase [Anaerolineae bacterium]|nr:nucleoside 2-deoxyribosyltransferase [Anaerolineae bacterium]